MPRRYGKFPRYAWARCPCGQVEGTVGQVRSHQANSPECKGKDPELLSGPPEGYKPPRGSKIEAYMVEQGLIAPPSDLAAAAARRRDDSDRAAAAAELSEEEGPEIGAGSSIPAWPGGPSTPAYAEEILARLLAKPGDDLPPPVGEGMPAPRSLRVLPDAPGRAADGTALPVPIEFRLTANTNMLTWFAWSLANGFTGTLSEYVLQVHDGFWDMLGARITAQFDPARARVAV